MRDESGTAVERILARIRSNPVVALLLVLASVVVGLSTFTNAARNLWGVLAPGEGRPAINGEWRADVNYDWQNARYNERFRFSGEGDTVGGSASYLGTPRGIVEGKAKKGTLQFTTRTRESMGGADKETAHRYQGTLQGDQIRFVMQTEGGFSEHLPIEFTARRVDAGTEPAASAAASAAR
jgi:hypothetical protein